MTDSVHLAAALDARVTRRAERRDFFKSAFGAVAAGAATLTLAGAAAAQTAAAAPSEADVLNFALNLEYLEAQFYSYAVTGQGLPGDLLTGTQTQGAVRGGRQVTFTDPVLARYAAEIAADEVAHVRFLRGQLGGAAVAQPVIDVSVSPTSAFSTAAVAAKIIAAGQSFDPYASEENFLLGAFLFEDVGVSAYKGAAAQLTSKAYIDAAAGILAVEAYHAATIRGELYRRGVAAAALITQAGGISDARDTLDGGTEIDQGIAATTTTKPDQTTDTTALPVSNIAPTDAFGIAFSRTTSQVLNIVYLTGGAASAGGFFPSGLNGAIKVATVPA